MGMRRVVLLWSTVLLAGCATQAACASSSASDEPSARLAILETTDLHTHVLGYDYDKLAADPHVGFDRVATLIENARREFPNTLLFDDGDTIQGTALADYQALAHPVPCNRELAIYRAMDLLHYDAGTIGNHEFNYGLPFLSQVTGTPMHLPDVPVEHCDGPHYPLVLSNVVRASDGAPVFKPWLLLTRAITVTDADGNARKVPIRIGMLGFAPPPIMQWDHAHLYGKVHALGVVEAAQKYLPELRAQHPDLVIALVHGGLDTAPYTPQMENAGWYLAGLPGVDLVLLGHSHAVFPDPDDPKSRFAHLRDVDNTRGFVRGKPAVMGGFYGRDLGVIDLALKQVDGKWTIDAAGTHSEVRPTCPAPGRVIHGLPAHVGRGAGPDSTSTRQAPKRLPRGGPRVARDSQGCVAPDPHVDAAVSQVNAATIRYVQTPIGSTDFRISSYFAAVDDGSTAAVINAAQLAYAKAHLFDTHPELKGLPMLSAASAFKTGFAGPNDYTDIMPGPLSIRSAADLYLYPNTLTVVKLDGAGVKAWLEKSAEYFNRIDPDATQPQPLLNPKFVGYNFDVLTGEPQDAFRYAIDLSQPIGRRVTIRFRGRALDPAQPFLIVTNNYRAEGGGHFPGLDGHATVYRAPDGNREAVIDYVRAQRNLRRADYDRHPWRFTKLKTRAPITFTCAADKLDAARADSIGDVLAMNGHTCIIDLSK